MGSIKDWAREHKKGIIIASGVCCAVVVGGVVIFCLTKGKKVPVPVKDLLTNAPKEPALSMATETVGEVGRTNVITFPRAEYIRQLPVGQHASPAKLAQAAEMGIELEPGKTIVNKTIVHRTYAA